MDHKLEPVQPLKGIAAGLLALGGAAVTLFAMSKFPFTARTTQEAPFDIEAIGFKILSYGEYGYVLPFEVISVLLLAAMVAAIIIAKKSVSND